MPTAHALTFGSAPAVERADPGPDIRILALAYPEFTISGPMPGRNGPAWAITRSDPSQPGLYAAVTPDLAELRDILALHATQHADEGM